MIYEPYTIVVVPFPFADQVKSKKRPALVISTEKFQKETGHISLLMITSAEHSEWFCDFLVKDLEKKGLPVRSFIRQKIFTIDLRLIEKSIGCLSKKECGIVKSAMKKCLSI